MKNLKGIHHVTAITSSAEKIYEFFTYTLGMRLVKKSVNQDDIHTYHLFFADDVGTPGTDMTFFDFQGIPKGTHGKNEISRTSFRVPSNAALEYWLKRFDTLEVEHEDIQVQFDKKVLPFEDFDGQRYQLISDENNTGVSSGSPWKEGPIPTEYAITGLGPIFVTVDQFEAFKERLEKIYLFSERAQEGAYHMFDVGDGGNGAQVIVEHNPDLPQSTQGYGSVHHAAFRVDDTEGLKEWIQRMQEMRVSNSGYVDRFYFESLYTRAYPFVLFEIATDGPGFMVDEPYETLGEKISLPPDFENQREEVENHVRHIDTVRSTKQFKKE